MVIVEERYVYYATDTPAKRFFKWYTAQLCDENPPSCSTDRAVYYTMIEKVSHNQTSLNSLFFPS